MPISVSDALSNRPDQIANAARVLGRSKDRRLVFQAIYRGKRKIKTVSDIHAATRLDRIRILQEAGRLAGHDIVKKVKANGETAYEKIEFISQNKAKILSLAQNKLKLDTFPTRANPRINNLTLKLPIPGKSFRALRVTIDDIDSFSRVKTIKSSQRSQPIARYEKAIKEGFKRVIGEGGTFTDWGGEKNDLFSTRLRLAGKRVGAAVAFKGRGKKGILRPAMMGKNGDQIFRLFQTLADVFLIQYWDQIDESILEHMSAFAIAKSAMMGGKRVYYGIIDGQDTERLVTAYPHQFR